MNTSKAATEDGCRRNSCGDSWSETQRHWGNANKSQVLDKWYQIDNKLLIYIKGCSSSPTKLFIFALDSTFDWRLLRTHVAFLWLRLRIHVAHTPKKEQLVLERESSTTKDTVTVRKLTPEMLVCSWGLHFQTASMDSDTNNFVVTVVLSSFKMHVEMFQSVCSKNKAEKLRLQRAVHLWKLMLLFGTVKSVSQHKESNSTGAEINKWALNLSVFN